MPARYKLKDSETLEVTPNVRCNSLFDVIAFAKLGLGVALLPTSVVNRLVTYGELVSLMQVSETPIYAVHQYQTAPPLKVRDFLRNVTPLLR